MDIQVKEWVQNGALEEWDKVREPGDPFIPVVVSPLGVEPSKPSFIGWEICERIFAEMFLSPWIMLQK